MARMRYVIKKPDEGYFTEVKAVESVPVKLHGVLIGHNTTYKPLFLGMQPAHATQFGDEASARSFMNETDYGAPDAFEGCVIEPNKGEHEELRS